MGCEHPLAALLPKTVIKVKPIHVGNYPFGSCVSHKKTLKKLDKTVDSIHTINDFGTPPEIASPGLRPAKGVSFLMLPCFVLPSI